jgi:hypothetical protein
LTRVLFLDSPAIPHRLEFGWHMHPHYFFWFTYWPRATKSLAIRVQVISLEIGFESLNIVYQLRACLAITSCLIASECLFPQSHIWLILSLEPLQSHLRAFPLFLNAPLGLTTPCRYNSVLSLGPCFKRPLHILVESRSLPSGHFRISVSVRSFQILSCFTSIALILPLLSLVCFIFDA